MATARLDGAAIVDWNSFHAACAKEFGFPDFYGRNGDAWIDCMTDVDVSNGLTRFTIGPQEFLEIEIVHSATLRERSPEILAKIAELVGYVNERFTDAGERPPLKLRLL